MALRAACLTHNDEVLGSTPIKDPVVSLSYFYDEVHYIESAYATDTGGWGFYLLYCLSTLVYN